MGLSQKFDQDEPITPEALLKAEELSEVVK